MKNIVGKLRSFLKNKDGSLAIYFAGVVPLLMLASITIFDVTSMMSTRSSMQDTMDMALTSALKKGVELKLAGESDAKVQQGAREEFENFYMTNFAQTTGISNFVLPAGAYTFNYDIDDHAISATLNYTFPSQIPGPLKVGNHDISVNGSVRMSATNSNFIIDVMLCIDATGSMQNTIDAVRAKAKSFNADLRKELGLGPGFENVKIRAKPYFFRDHYDVHKIKTRSFVDLDPNKSSPVSQSKANQQLKNFLSSEMAYGGYDRPEAAGACIYDGIHADWMDGTSPVAKQYFSEKGLGGAPIFNIPVIVIWTDAPIAPLPRTRQYVHSDVPNDYPAFEAMWEDPANIQQERKIMIMFGPVTEAGWNTVSNWDRFTYGGSLSVGNKDAIKIIAQEIKESVPELLRIDS